MKNEIKEIIAERIKYHSNKQKYGYFIGNDCIDICASDILEDVIKAGYRKQADVAREFAERVLKDISDAIDHNTRLAFGSISPETSNRALITNNACKGIYDTVVAIAKEYGVEE